MSRPAWYPRVARHPDYGGDRVILVDTNVFSDMAIRAKWTEEFAWVINCPVAELRIKINGRLLEETVGAHAKSKMKPNEYQDRWAFIDTYRHNGKILIDDGAVPFFAIDRITTYDLVTAEFARFQKTATKHDMNAEDIPVVVDAIVNRIPLLTGDTGVASGLDLRLGIQGTKNNGDAGIIGVLKARGLWDQREQILLRDPRFT